MEVKDINDWEFQFSRVLNRACELLERNKQLISDISVLRSYERIEKIATEELDMHFANTDEIIRVKIKAD